MVSDEWIEEYAKSYEENAESYARAGMHRTEAVVRKQAEALRELQERRAADTMRPEWHHDEQAALDAASDEALRIVDDAVESDATGGDTWKPSDIGGTTCAPETTWMETAERIMQERADAWKKLAAIDAGEVLMPEDSSSWKSETRGSEPEGPLADVSKQVEGALNNVTVAEERIAVKPLKLARRVKRLRDEVRVLFGAVGELTTSKYELGDDLIALAERVAVLESWRSAFIDGQNDGCAEEEWERRMDEMRAVLRPPRRDCFAIRSQLWECDVVVGGAWRTFYGPTAVAAVAVAWKAWEGARDAQS